MANTRGRYLATGMAVVVVVWAITCCGTHAEGLSRVKRPPPDDARQRRREQAVMDEAGIDKWPQSDRLTAAPVVDRSFLSNADIVTGENIGYIVVMLDGTECGEAWITWRRVAPSDAPLPTELPAGIRESLDKATEGMPADKKKRVYDNKLERYRRSKAFTVKGMIEAKMVVAPSSRAAQEWLIFESTLGTAPTESVAAQFEQSKRVDGLGDVAFKGDRFVRMVRGNVAVMVRGSGDFLPEVEKLAARIDAAIAKEPVLATFQAGRPHVAAGSLRNESATVPGQPAYSFTATAPGGRTVARVRATVNGQEAPVKNDEVLLGVEKGQLALKISAITDGLLVTSIEENVFLVGE